MNFNCLFCMNLKGEVLKVFFLEMFELLMGVVIGFGINIVVVNVFFKIVLWFMKDGYLVEIKEIIDNYNNGFGLEVVCCYGDVCVIVVG